jgi:hypothetical protein
MDATHCGHCYHCESCSSAVARGCRTCAYSPDKSIYRTSLNSRYRGENGEITDRDPARGPIGDEEDETYDYPDNWIQSPLIYPNSPVMNDPDTPISLGDDSIPDFEAQMPQFNPVTPPAEEQCPTPESLGPPTYSAESQNQTNQGEDSNGPEQRAIRDPT